MDSYNSKTKYVLHIENSARKSRNIFSNFLTNNSLSNFNKTKTSFEPVKKIYTTYNLNFPGHKLVNSQFNQFRANNKMTRYNKSHNKGNSFRSIDLGSTSTEFNSTRNPFKFIRKVDLDINNLLNPPTSQRNILNIFRFSKKIKFRFL